MNIDQFTLKAQDAIQQANSIAQQEDHSEIGTEHLLLALLEQEDGVIPPLVERIGLKVSTLIQQVEDLLATYPRITGNAQVSFSPEAQKIIDNYENVAKSKTSFGWTLIYSSKDCSIKGVWYSDGYTIFLLDDSVINNELKEFNEFTKSSGCYMRQVRIALGDPTAPQKCDRCSNCKQGHHFFE